MAAILNHSQTRYEQPKATVKFAGKGTGYEKPWTLVQTVTPPITGKVNVEGPVISQRWTEVTILGIMTSPRVLHSEHKKCSRDHRPTRYDKANHGVCMLTRTEDVASPGMFSFPQHKPRAQRGI